MWFNRKLARQASETYENWHAADVAAVIRLDATATALERQGDWLEAMGPREEARAIRLFYARHPEGVTYAD